VPEIYAGFFCRQEEREPSLILAVAARPLDATESDAMKTNKPPVRLPNVMLETERAE
jgi:hypothetical protein